MKYFGTDGIRGLVNKDINTSLLKKLAKALVKYYEKNKLKKVLLVGNDSRTSSDYILSVLCSVLLNNGIKVDNLGVCSSPCLAFVTKKYNYPLGLMISASHNPYQFNGLKFFNSNGEKVNEEFEENIEFYIDKNVKTKNNDFTKLNLVENLKLDYISHLKKLKKFNLNCIFDCANGGTSEICKKLFPKQEKININPKGLNINKNCGCTHLDMLKNLCIKRKKIGFAFDGDGDRIHIISESGEIIKGDKILYILSKFFQISGNTVVGTIYTNSALNISLKSRNINLIRTNVGDKNVVSAMQTYNSTLGGENSGHIVLKPYTNTGDGVLIAIIIANLLTLSNLTLDEILKDFKEYYHIRANLNLTKEQMDSLKFDEISKTYSNNLVKTIVRPSGTEPVLRLFVESQDKSLAQNTLNEIKNLIVNLV